MKAWTIQFDTVMTCDGKLEEDASYSDEMVVVADDADVAIAALRADRVGVETKGDEGETYRIEGVEITNLSIKCDVDIVAKT